MLLYIYNISQQSLFKVCTGVRKPWKCLKNWYLARSTWKSFNFDEASTLESTTVICIILPFASFHTESCVSNISNDRTLWSLSSKWLFLIAYQTLLLGLKNIRMCNQINISYFHSLGNFGCGSVRHNFEWVKFKSDNLAGKELIKIYQQIIQQEKKLLLKKKEYAVIDDPPSLCHELSFCKCRAFILKLISFKIEWYE